MADTDRIDERLRDQDGTPDDEQIRRFCAAARAAGIAVMTDLVINHTADNARLVQERPDLFMREPDGSIMHPAAVDPDDPSIRTVWGDLAELDYHSPAARQALTGSSPPTSPGCRISASAASGATPPTRCRPRCGAA